MSTYCARTDLNNLFGTSVVTDWATLTSDDEAADITARVNAAIAWASAEIDDFARRGEYTVPLATSGGSTPTTITHLAAVLAGLWLYEATGALEFNANTGRPNHRYAYRRVWALRMLKEIREGERKLDAVI